MHTDSVPRAFWANLRAGTRLALLRPVGIEAFRIDLRQAVLLFLFCTGLKFGYDFLITDPPRAFDPSGLSVLGTLSLLFLFCAYLVAQVRRRLDLFPAFVVLMLATGPVARAVTELYFYYLNSGTVADSQWRSWGVWGLATLWGVVVATRAVGRVFPGGRLRTLLTALLYTGLMGLASWYLEPLNYSWYTPDEAPPAPAAVNVEDVYYEQPALLARELRALRPQRPGVHDLYFVGMGGTAGQDVFLREVTSVRRLFDRRFDTAGRSLLLVNNPATVDRLPLANAHNLRAALAAVRSRMDPAEDVLFLYLSSHGSPGDLALEFQPLAPNDLTAPELRRILDESGIRWRVVVVSACYSGSFVDALKDDHTLVITAAAADRSSFGCDSENDFTYFGDAYFNQALSREFSFTDAFRRAADAIARRESREKLEPSEPQISVGAAMGRMLPALERRLASRAIAAAPVAVPAGCGKGSDCAPASRR